MDLACAVPGIPNYPRIEAQSSWIVSKRPARNKVDPFEPNAFFLEQELSAAGRIVPSAVILLTNKECPWRCLMCDLWRNTTTHSVPAGAIPRQIRYALSQLQGNASQIKLYNSGSFFDPAAIPPEDYPAIAAATASARHLVVECHPRLVRERALSFRGLLAGTLEVALGLETVHPEVLPRLNKRFTLDHFARAVECLRRHEIAVRAFVLVKPPFLNDAEALEWAVKSAEYAFNLGADVVSLIPTRTGNGALDHLREAGQFSPPRLSTLERALERVLSLRGAGRAFADTWDLGQFSDCPHCLDLRSRRLHAMNLSQQVQATVECPHCHGA